jgi:hypothetical protein
MSLQDDLLKIERSFWTGGPEAYEANADTECLVVFTEMAGVMKKDDIARTAEKGRWKDVELQAKGLAELSEDSAVVSYECTAKRKDGAPYHAVVSSGYVKRADGWKLAFHQQTPM